MISKEVQPSLLFPLKDRFKAKGNIALHVGIAYLITSLLLTVVESMAIDVLLGTTIIDEHILDILTEKQKVAV